MSEPTDIGRTADATKEVAKATSKAIDASTKAGEFFSKVMGDLITDGVGLVGDRIRFYRIERAVLLAERTDALLKGRNVTSVRAVAPNIALPIIEAAATELDDDLHAKWAELLAQAMDAEAHVVDRRLIDALLSLSPTDSKVFDAIAQCALDEDHASTTQLQTFWDDESGDKKLAMTREEVQISYGMVLWKYVEKFAPERFSVFEDGRKSILENNPEECQIAIDNLASLGLLMIRNTEWADEDGQVFLEGDGGRSGMFFVTEFGRRFAASIGYHLPRPRITYFPLAAKKGKDAAQ